jgi:taurine dioxygenase
MLGSLLCDAIAAKREDIFKAEYWHPDVSCDEEPPMGSILYLHTAPSCGGDTLFASQYAAYDALSPRMKVERR